MRAIVFAAVCASALLSSGIQAQTVTAFKTGERTTGMTKQCYYAFGSSEYTRTVSSVELCPLSIKVATVPASPQQPPQPTPPPEPPMITAFKVGEKTTGMTKQCDYRFGSSEYTKTVQAVELCPLSIKVRR